MKSADQFNNNSSGRQPFIIKLLQNGIFELRTLLKISTAIETVELQSDFGFNLRLYPRECFHLIEIVKFDVELRLLLPCFLYDLMRRIYDALRLQSQSRI